MTNWKKEKDGTKLLEESNDLLRENNGLLRERNGIFENILSNNVNTNLLEDDL